MWVQFPGNTHSDKTYIARMHCKSLWIKASVKCKCLLNVLNDYIYQSLQDFAILRSLNLSQNQTNSAIFTRACKFSYLPQIFLSLKNGMNSLAFSSCPIYKSYIGQTNRKRNESVLLCSADRLSARAGAAGCSRSRDTVIHSAGRYSEESSRIRRRINNISVKSCEKHLNLAQNSVKATDIRTNATHVETRKNIVQ